MYSRAKDDTQDSDFLADLLLTHPAKLPGWSPEDSATRAVQQLGFHRRAVVDERTGLTNRLQALLKSYFPQALLLCGEDLWRPLATAFLLKWPTRQEVQRRELGRQREFWKREVRRLENHGRALRIEHEHATLPGGWAGPRKWKQLSVECSAFVRGQLAPVAEHIRTCQAELQRLTRELEALVAVEQIPHGLGALTVALLDGEVCDWGRFKHRKAVGKLFGEIQVLGVPGSPMNTPKPLACVPWDVLTSSSPTTKGYIWSSAFPRRSKTRNFASLCCHPARINSSGAGIRWWSSGARALARAIRTPNMNMPE